MERIFASIPIWVEWTQRVISGSCGFGGRSDACRHQRVVDSIDMTGIPSHFALIQNNLREASLRHMVTSQNIANVNTPGYQAKELVDFAETMLEVNGTEQSNLIRDKSGLTARLDGNNVDIDKEIGGLKRNALAHNVYTQILASKISQMRSAISDR